MAIACLGTFVFGWVFSGSWPWGPAVFAAIDWFVINLLNRVADLEEDAANGILGADVAARHPRAFSGLCACLLLGSLVASHWLLPALTIPRLLCHLIGFPYNFRLLPGGRRFKELYFFKNTASACIFLLTVFVYPLAAAGWAAGFLSDVGWGTVVGAAAFFFLFELSYEVLYDLRDAPGDRLAGVRTYPVVHGERVAIRIVDGLIVSSLLVLVGGYLAGLLPWRVAVMTTAPLLQLGLSKVFLRGQLSSAHCVGLTWLGAGQLLAYHLWVVAGLPTA